LTEVYVHAACAPLPGHPAHPEPAFPGLPTGVKFVQGRWWAGGVGTPPKYD